MEEEMEWTAELQSLGIKVYRITWETADALRNSTWLEKKWERLRRTERGVVGTKLNCRSPTSTRTCLVLSCLTKRLSTSKESSIWTGAQLEHLLPRSTATTVHKLCLHRDSSPSYVSSSVHMLVLGDVMAYTKTLPRTRHTGLENVFEILYGLMAYAIPRICLRAREVSLTMGSIVSRRID